MSTIEENKEGLVEDAKKTKILLDKVCYFAATYELTFAFYFYY